MVQPCSQKPLYSLFGKIVHGRGIGKLVGAPTANLQILSQDSLPPIGVYIAEITLEGQVYHGVTNIGTRPTVDNDKDISVETFIIDFHRDIYGKEMGVHLFKKLRNPQKFCDFSMLLEQIRQDCIAAQDFFGVNSTISQLHMSIEKHQATINGQPIYLSRKEFDVLYLLYSNPDIAFKKEQIYEAVWHEISAGYFHAVENTVFQIRRKCKAYGDSKGFVRTIVGYGYQFDTS